MKKDTTTNILLLVIAIALIAIAIRPLRVPRAVRAAEATAYPFYIEPGIVMLRAPDGSGQVYGKMAVDLRNGKIWGFPTLTTSNYPVDIGSSKPPVSHPFLLGTFALSDTGR
ncbi:MAG: hypothetical protein ABI164_04005 [Acidobacteriaceae bacterium]